MDVGRRSVVVAAVIGLALPSTALAQQTIAPPGKSGADQYFETLPSAKGNVAPPSGGAGAGGSGGASIRSLERLGRDGQAAGALAAATTPPGGSRGTGNGAATANSRSPLGTLTHVLDGSDAGGIGIALPILLFASLALAIFLALFRLRRRDDAV